MLTLARGLLGEGSDPPVEEIAFLVRQDTPLFAAARAAGYAAFDSGRGEADSTRWLRQRQFDLVHVHAGIGWEGHGLVAAANDAGIPVVRTEHLPCPSDDNAGSAAFAAMSGTVARHIAVSEGVHRSFRESGLLAAPMSVVRNGIAGAQPSVGGTEPAAFEKTRSCPLLLNVGRFEAQKGHALLLEAAALLRARGMAFSLLLVGDGPGRPMIVELVRELGLAGCIRFAGQRGDVSALMRTADLLVHAGAFEGLPLVLLEAMAAGLPIAALPAPGVDETIDLGTAFLAEGASAAALADAIARALADAPGRQRVAAAARRRQDSEFTAARMARETLAAYATIQRTPTPVTSTKIGFIGAGGIAARHLGVLQGMEDVAVVGLTDPDRARADALAADCGAQAFADAEAMIAAVRPDALFICVPPFAHGEAEALALAHGLPFFTEKPIALDLDRARSTARQVEAAGLVTAVGYHWRYLDTLDSVRETIGGRQVRLVSGYWLDATPPPRWWWRQDMSGGQMAEQATHLIDLARYLVGDAASVYAMAEHTPRTAFDELDVATSSTAAIRFEGGAIGNFAATCLLGWNHRVGLHLFGDGFAIELTDRDAMIDIGAGRPVIGNHSDPVFLQDRAFIDAVRGGENRIRCSYADALATLEVSAAITRSLESGQQVTLAEPGPAAMERAA